MRLSVRNLLWMAATAAVVVLVFALVPSGPDAGPYAAVVPGMFLVLLIGWGTAAVRVMRRKAAESAVREGAFAAAVLAQADAERAAAEADRTAASAHPDGAAGEGPSAN